MRSRTFPVWAVVLTGALASADQDWEAAAVQSRLKIVSGDMTFRMERFAVDAKTHEPGIEPAQFVCRERLIFDFTSGRLANLRHEQPSRARARMPDGRLLPRADESVPSVRSIILLADRCLLYTPDQLSDGTTFGIQEVPFAEEGVGKLCQQEVLDPRLFGMAPDAFGLLYEVTLSTYFGRPDRSGTNITEEVVRGVHCKCIEYTRLDDRRIRIWLSPDQGNSVLRIELDRTKPNGEHARYGTESDLIWHTDAGIWFPQRIVWRQWRNGDLEAYEQIVVEQAEFNRPVAQTAFSIEGLSPHKNATFFEIDPPNGYGRKWDGERLIPISNDPVVRPPLATNSIHWLWFANLAVVGVVLIAVYLRRIGARRE